MSTFSIFKHLVGSSTFEVWLTGGVAQFVVNGTIRHDISSVTEFLVAAAKLINKPDNTDDMIVEQTGTISVDALENVQGGVLALDTNGTNPGIALQDDGTEVRIHGGGVSGALRVDFGTGGQAQGEAAKFLAFAQDLLGPTTTTLIGTETGVQIGAYTRTVTISTRDDDIREIKFGSTGDKRDVKWADIVVDDLAAQFGGTKLSDGKVDEVNYKAVQLGFETPTIVRMGFNGVSGTEKFEFANADDATAFRDAILATFGPGSDRVAVINRAIEVLAENLDGVQLSDGVVSLAYKAAQISRTGAEVHLGFNGVGGTEKWKFEDADDAQMFLDQVRDAMGLEGGEGKLVDEFVFKVSGGAGISGSPTFVGKDAFVHYIATEFGGVQLKNGSVSESFDGAVSYLADDSQVKLGPRNVGGTEIWDFADAATAQAFAATLDQIFG